MLRSMMLRNTSAPSPGLGNGGGLTAHSAESNGILSILCFFTYLFSFLKGGIL
jgi:hypothetical protein